MIFDKNKEINMAVAEVARKIMFEDVEVVSESVERDMKPMHKYLKDLGLKHTKTHPENPDEYGTRSYDYNGVDSAKVTDHLKSMGFKKDSQGSHTKNFNGKTHRVSVYKDRVEYGVDKG